MQQVCSCKHLVIARICLNKFRARQKISKLAWSWSISTIHVYSPLKRRGNDRFRVVSTWNTRGMFVGMPLFPKKIGQRITKYLLIYLCEQVTCLVFDVRFTKMLSNDYLIWLTSISLNTLKVKWFMLYVTMVRFLSIYWKFIFFSPSIQSQYVVFVNSCFANVSI